MANELIINASLPETRIALMENGEIQELLIERASGKGIVGNIYKGRVTRVLPGMQAAFVDIGLEKAAFLYVDDVYVHSEIWEDEEEAPHRSGTHSLSEGGLGNHEDPDLAGVSSSETADQENASVVRPAAIVRMKIQTDSLVKITPENQTHTIVTVGDASDSSVLSVEIEKSPGDQIDETTGSSDNSENSGTAQDVDSLGSSQEELSLNNNAPSLAIESLSVEASPAHSAELTSFSEGDETNANRDSWNLTPSEDSNANPDLENRLNPLSPSSESDSLRDLQDEEIEKRYLDSQDDDEDENDDDDGSHGSPVKMAADPREPKGSGKEAAQGKDKDVKEIKSSKSQSMNNEDAEKPSGTLAPPPVPAAQKRVSKEPSARSIEAAQKRLAAAQAAAASIAVPTVPTVTPAAVALPLEVQKSSEEIQKREAGEKAERNEKSSVVADVQVPEVPSLPSISKVSASDSNDSEGEDEGPDSLDNQEDSGTGPNRKRHRRGKRGGRFRKKTALPENASRAPAQQLELEPTYPENYHEQVAETGNLNSDRSGIAEEVQEVEEGVPGDNADAGRPENTQPSVIVADRRTSSTNGGSEKEREKSAEFRSHRSRDRRIRQKTSARPVRAQVNIQDLLKEGQEVLVQVAKDPIATKGARLTCHISLPGRHLVCMPTIDHVGVSRRIEKEDERRRLREYVERNRPRNLGFIVRTASGKQQSEKRIKQDIDYLTRLWTEIREKASNVTAPSLVYEDLNAVLRAIRDWVTEEIDKVVVDSRYHFNEIHRFVSHFMPPLKQKVELYHGDIPIFDAYGISTELSRALERKVWLKSGGYIVVDQAEALVAIDVNTGRYVGKKNLEDTILKTNLEAVQEIAYQLRLRNCGGIIILDFIDMEKEENKQRVYRALEEALARDRARPSILKISELGLVEMTRKRTRDTIVRSLCESCTHCEGKGFIKSKQTVAYEAMREIEREGLERDTGKILVQAHPDVIDILAIDERDTLDQLERRYRKQIYLQAVVDFHPEQFEVSVDKQNKPEKNRIESTRNNIREQSERTGEHSGERSRGRDKDQRDRDKGRDRDPEREQGGGRQYRIDPSASQTTIIMPVGQGPALGGNGGSTVQIRPSIQPQGQVQTQIYPPNTVISTGIVPAGGARQESDDIQGGVASTTVNSNPRIEVTVKKPIDPDSIGNTADGIAREREEGGIGGGGLIQPRSSAGGVNPVSPSPVKSQDEFFDEEDRLAFLRAQAAQDAALARLGSNTHSPSRIQNEPAGSGRGGANNPRRGGRGRRTNTNNPGSGSGSGKFRGRNDRNRDRGLKPHAGYNNPNQAKWNNENQKEAAPPSTPQVTPDTSSGNKNDGEGGGGDHSQPPV